MRRSHLVLLMLLTFAATASAQNPVVGQAISIGVGPQSAVDDVHASPDDVVARLMSFDRNGDGKVAKEELLERMENIVTRGDGDGDGALSAAEIRWLANEPPAQIAVRGFQAGHYGFGDESGQSSRLHIEGALADLKLASPAKEEAGAIAKAFADGLEKEASANLLKEMEDVLTPEQFATFKTGVDHSKEIIVRSTNANTQNLDAIVQQLRVRLVVLDLTRLLDQFKLPAEQKAKAVAAIEQFKNPLRQDVERAALLEQLHDVLSEQERDDFRAALERRPVVKAGPVFVGGVQGDVILQRVVVR